MSNYNVEKLMDFSYELANVNCTFSMSILDIKEQQIKSSSELQADVYLGVNLRWSMS